VWFLSVAAHSQDVAIHFETGNTLADNLNSDKVLGRGVALGYVSGVIDSLMNLQYGAGRVSDVAQQMKDYTKGKTPHSDPSLYHPMNICIPDGANTGQMVKVVQKYLDDHPEKLAQPAAALVEEATRKAFPCN
jgi:hypothetical protein